MYLPYLRGRQNELLALKELVNNNLIGDKVIPIIEPTKLSSTLISVIRLFNSENRKLIVIQNPQVGNFEEELKDNEGSYSYYDLINNDNIIKGIIATDNFEKDINKLRINNVDNENIVVILREKKYINLYKDEFDKINRPLYTLIPDKKSFRRKIYANKIVLEDHFRKRERNTDYDEEPEFFSSDHADYDMDNFKGFSDYSIIGEEYKESGFAPRAVAIHISFLDDDELYVKHFVSDSNDSIKDPAKKFYEALKKLMDWKEEVGLQTYGLSGFEECFEKQQYPGLGVVKKLALMHHIQLINDYLEDNN
ncbi:sce7725 family protein [Clostridium perfringens]